MLNLDIDKLEQAVTEAERDLRGGMVSLDLWDTSTGLSLASYNSNPVGAAVFNGMTGDTADNLNQSGLAGWDRFIIIDLQDNHMMIGLRESDQLMGLMHVDQTRTNLGILVSVVIPKVLRMMNEARLG